MIKTRKSTLTMSAAAVNQTIMQKIVNDLKCAETVREQISAGIDLVDIITDECKLRYKSQYLTESDFISAIANALTNWTDDGAKSSCARAITLLCLWNGHKTKVDFVEAKVLEPMVELLQHENDHYAHCACTTLNTLRRASFAVARQLRDVPNIINILENAKQRGIPCWPTLEHMYNVTPTPSGKMIKAARC